MESPSTETHHGQTQIERAYYTEIKLVVEVAVGRKSNVLQRGRERQRQRGCVKLDAGTVHQIVRGHRLVVELSNGVNAVRAWKW